MKELFLLLKFDNSSSSVTRDKDFSDVYELMTHYLLSQITQWNPLNIVTIGTSVT